MGEVARHFAYEPEHNQQSHVEDEEVGRYGEDAACFPDAAQIAEGKDHDEGDAHGHRHPGLPSQRGRRGDDGIGARRDRDGNRDGVADQKGCAGDLRDVRAKVVPADDVRSPRLRIGPHDIPVTDGHHGQYRQDRRGHGRDDGERGEPGDGDEDPQHLLRRIGGGRHDVRGQDGERSRLAQPLAMEILADQGRPEEHALDPVATALGQAGGDRRVRPRGRTSEVVHGPVVFRPPGCRHAGHGYGLVPVPVSLRIGGGHGGPGPDSGGDVYREPHPGQFF